MPSVELRGEPFTVADGYDKFWRKATAGRWEQATFEAISRCVDADTVVLDIGAWIGPTVLYAARHARRVEAFEPDPASVAVLQQNLALNPHVASKVRVHQNAVWTEARSMAMGNRRNPGDSMSSLLETGAAHTWTVECLAAGDLADLLEPDDKLFIKMDVEGAEYDVLPALAPLLDRPNVAVLVAFHPHMVGSGWPRFLRTRGATRDAFKAFDGFRVERVTRRRIRPAIGPAVARATGAWLFEADENFLFQRAR